LHNDQPQIAVSPLFSTLSKIGGGGAENIFGPWGALIFAPAGTLDMIFQDRQTNLVNGLPQACLSKEGSGGDIVSRDTNLPPARTLKDTYDEAWFDSNMK
jgi:hypothetical protein